MEPPLIKLIEARIVRLTHIADQDSIRIKFDSGAQFIAYNNGALNNLVLMISQPTCDFSLDADVRVESIERTDQELIFRLSNAGCIRIGLRERDSCGPEAFQIILPGYPPIVEQNE